LHKSDRKNIKIVNMSWTARLKMDSQLPKNIDNAHSDKHDYKNIPVANKTSYIIIISYIFAQNRSEEH